MFKVSQAQAGPLPYSQGNDWIVNLTLTDRPAPDRRPFHFTFKIDVSGSMALVLEQVKRNVESFINALPSSSYVSLVIFSGHNQAELIAGPTQCDAQGRKLLVRALSSVHVLSTTVFSEGFEKVLQSVQRLGTAVRHEVIALTDGCPVPDRWSYSAELARSFDLAKTLLGASAKLSAIGYGNYYNEVFLQGLLKYNGNSGVLRHINSIGSFRSVIDEIMGISGRTRDVSFELSTDIGKDNPGVALRTTPQIAVIGDSRGMYFRGAVDNQVSLIIVVPKGTTEFTLGGKIGNDAFLEQVECQPLDAKSTLEAALALGAWALQNHQQQEAARILDAAEQPGLAIKVANAYTTRERLEAADELRRSLLDQGVVQKYSKKVYIGKGEAACGVNVLRKLVENPNCSVYIPEGAYERTTVAVTEANFRRKAGSRMKVTRLVSNQERYNLSLGVLVDGEQKNETTSNWEATVRHRCFVVYKDGNRHLDALEAHLTQEVFNQMVEWEVIGADQTFSEQKVYTIDLTELPVVVRSWASPKQLGLVELLAEELDLKVKQTAINARIKELRAQAGGGSGTSDFYARTKLTDGLDSYEAPCYQYTLQGFTPNKVSYANIAKLDQAEERGREIRQRLGQVRFVSRLILMAMDLTGNKLFADVVPIPVKRSTLGKMEQVVSVAPITNNSAYAACTLRRVTWRENIPFTKNEDEGQEDQPQAA